MKKCSGQFSVHTSVSAYTMLFAKILLQISSANTIVLWKKNVSKNTNKVQTIKCNHIISTISMPDLVSLQVLRKGHLGSIK